MLNAGLALAMEWGEHFLKPIQQRLSQRYPQLSAEQLEQYNTLCRQAMFFGHGLLPQVWQEAGGVESVARALWQSRMLERYPWVNEENLGHLISQAFYYAWKDGELGVRNG